MILLVRSTRARCIRGQGQLHFTGSLFPGGPKGGTGPLVTTVPSPSCGRLRRWRRKLDRLLLVSARQKQREAPQRVGSLPLGSSCLLESCPRSGVWVPGVTWTDCLHTVVRAARPWELASGSAQNTEVPEWRLREPKRRTNCYTISRRRRA